METGERTAAFRPIGSAKTRKTEKIDVLANPVYGPALRTETTAEVFMLSRAQVQVIVENPRIRSNRIR